MIGLREKVRRLAVGSHAEYDVTLHPGRREGGPQGEPSIELRMAGHGRSWAIELGRLYVLLVETSKDRRRRLDWVINGREHATRGRDGAEG